MIALDDIVLAKPLTGSQVGFFAGLAVVFVLWTYSEIVVRKSSLLFDETSDSEVGFSNKKDFSAGESKGHKQQESFVTELLQNDAVSCLCLSPGALARCNVALRAMVEFGAIMVWFFLADRTNALPEGTKSYSRDTFFFIYALLVLYNFSQGTRVWKAPALLNRSQTEEWKGWMQVLFLLYHYFEARDMYNAIRVFIAAYVWMTGFGNFLYYHKTKDYTLGRFVQMVWRLNFLVLFVCIALGNSYMLYYICPMHTIFTFFVYGTLAIRPDWNESNLGIACKIAASAIAIHILWDIKSVFYAVWSPMSWLVGYVDPRRPKNDVLHEWFFRSSLDRYVWIYGMICGWIRPAAEKGLQTLDAMKNPAKGAARAALLMLFLSLGMFWYRSVFTLPKFEYNALHPFTSWIPITVWIALRNLTPGLRMYSLGIFAWMGCITLETYICQYHTWLHSGIPDGQPVSLLVLIPQHPLMNFIATTSVYGFVSHRLFLLTNELKEAIVPLKNNRRLVQNLLLMGSGMGAAYVAGLMMV